MHGDKNWPREIAPSTVNAFYMYKLNQLLLPAGVLQLPVFSAAQAMALNFGHAGNYMGHEVLHGFDDTGRKYDAYGGKK